MGWGRGEEGALLLFSLLASRDGSGRVGRTAGGLGSSQLVPLLASVAFFFFCWPFLESFPPSVPLCRLCDFAGHEGRPWRTCGHEGRPSFSALSRAFSF